MTYFRKPKLEFIRRYKCFGRKVRYILSIAFILALFLSITTQAQIYDGFIYWLTNVPSADEEGFSGNARVDGRMYCTDGYYLWNFSVYAYNNTLCPNGAPLINAAELDGYLADPAIDSYADSSDQATFDWVIQTVVPGAIWCGNFPSPVTNEWTLNTNFNNCSSPSSGPVGGCNGPPYSNGACAYGFVNMGGMCTRSLAFQSNCGQFGGYDDFSCGCNGSCDEGGSCSPIVVDVLGNGFNLTNSVNGVNFDVDGNGTREHRAWTSGNSDDAWARFGP